MDIWQYQILSGCNIALNNIRKMEMESATVDSFLVLDKSEVFGAAI
jgi:hypothetical protein